MQEIVQVSHLEDSEKLKAYIADFFKRGRFEEINETVGMHSLFIKPEYSRADLSMLLHYVLSLIKNKISTERGDAYPAWLAAFPKRLTELIEGKSLITSKASADVLGSRFSGYGPFRSVDEFFFWAMEDKRLPLGDIVAYIEKTAKT